MNESISGTTTGFELEDSSPLTTSLTESGPVGLSPVAAFLVAVWYSITAAAAMSKGFAYLHPRTEDRYSLVQITMWAAGIGIGTWFAVLLAKTRQLMVGVSSALALSGLLLAILFLVPGEQASGISIFGHSLSFLQILVAYAVLVFTTGLIGTAAGRATKDNVLPSEPLFGIRHRHFFWLWLAVYAWVSVVPTAVYYVWLATISYGYTLIHPSLWLREAWTGTWTLTFGLWGICALGFGIDISLRNASIIETGFRPTWKRVLLFLMGTLILAGPITNLLLRIAIHSLKHLPDGITPNPWWVLR